MSRSADLIKRRDAAVCRGVGRLSLLTAASGKGAILTDVDGREYIDFAGGIGVMNVGHCDEAVVEAINSQANELMHTCIHVATYEGYVALCEELIRRFPHGEGGTRAMLVNTGAEAVENAIKIARQATGRQAVICYTGAFHGRTFMAATLTSKVGYKAGCGPYAPEVYRLPFPARGAGEQLSEEEVAERELRRLREVLKNTVAPEHVAAIIIELVQGEGGFSVAPTSYVRGLREICDDHGIVLIIDEVQSGFCRTGTWAAYEQYGVEPDVSTWAKALGGGLPISAVLGKAAVMDRVNPGTLGGTYGGNPVACSAALAAIRKMDELDLNGRARRIGKTIRARFDGLADRLAAITDVRGVGAMLAFEMHEDGDPLRPAGAMVKSIIQTCLENGLLIIPAGVDGNVVRILAPLVIREDELTRGLDILEEAVLAHVGRTPSPVGA
jgi:4-aminobutyrate aminotransferase/(S)-3-amino-2-methylpropionate transaminase